jgi:hypothetical protein
MGFVGGQMPSLPRQAQGGRVEHNLGFVVKPALLVSVSVQGRKSLSRPSCRPRRLEQITHHDLHHHHDGEFITCEGRGRKGGANKVARLREAKATTLRKVRLARL